MAQQHLRLNDSRIDAAPPVPILLAISSKYLLFTPFQTPLSTRSPGAPVLTARFDSKAAPSPALAPTTFWTRAASRPPHEADPSHSPFDIGHWRWPMRKSGFTGGSTGRAGPEGGRSQGRRWRSFGVKPSRQNWCSWRSSRQWCLERCEEQIF